MAAAYFGWSKRKEVLSKFVTLPSTTANTSESQVDSIDTVFSYACSTLSFGLLYQEYIDSVCEGDGNRIIRIWRYLFLVFRAAGRTNYAIEAFHLLVQEKFLLSPRLAKQLKWSRTVNTSGLPGKNIPCDLHMEHLNKEYKKSLCGLGSNITDHSVQRIGKCLGQSTKVMEHFDQIIGLPRQSGRHVRWSSEDDLDRVIQELTEKSNVFKIQQGRKHSFSSRFTSSIQGNKVLLHELEKWMEDQYFKLQIYQ